MAGVFAAILFAQASGQLLPREPNLPRATSEEYCWRFLELLHSALQAYPPAVATAEAVNLLVAVAEMQRYGSAS